MRTSEILCEILSVFSVRRFADALLKVYYHESAGKVRELKHLSFRLTGWEVAKLRQARSQDEWDDAYVDVYGLAQQVQASEKCTAGQQRLFN